MPMHRAHNVVLPPWFKTSPLNRKQQPPASFDKEIVFVFFIVFLLLGKLVSHSRHRPASLTVFVLRVIGRITDSAASTCKRSTTEKVPSDSRSLVSNEFFFSTQCTPQGRAFFRCKTANGRWKKLEAGLC